MVIKYDEILAEAGYSKKAIDEVRAGKLHYGGSLDAASDKELSVKLAFHVDAKLQNVAGLFMRFPKKKEFDDRVIALGKTHHFLYPLYVPLMCTNFMFMQFGPSLLRNGCRRWRRRFAWILKMSN
jgi:hypothetical protein